MVESKGCDNCGAVQAFPQFTCRDHVVVQCRQCGLMYVSPQPPDSLLIEHYQSSRQWGGERQRETELGSRGLYTQVLANLPRNGGEVLDIGCSSGVFLEMLARSGHAATGIELNQSAAQAAMRRGFQVYTQPLLQLQLAAQRFSAVVLLNVIEHLRAPMETCREIWRVLKPEGALVLVTPNTGFALPLIDLYLRRKGDRDISSGLPTRISQIHPPDHLYFYTAASLARLLAGAGFVAPRIQNAYPITNRSRSKTLSKRLVWAAAEMVGRTTRQRCLIGHSLMGLATKGSEPLWRQGEAQPIDTDRHFTSL